jgi:ribonuclease J
LKEHNLSGIAELHCVTIGEPFQLGCFTVECVRTTHSIADSVAIAVKTPVGMVIHTGDFKVDYTPISGKPIDLQRFAQLGTEGVLLFMCESTNVEQKGYTMSERSVGVIFEDIFEQSPTQRIMVATFSSNIHRIQQIINSAVKRNRKVLILGRSMVNAVKTASELGHLEIPSHVLIEVSEIKNYTDAELVIITTGSQGEPMAALSRMASSEHRQIEIKPGDKIIVSASPIPGNEKTISRVINELMKKGADVLYEGLMDVHVSGHAKQEEIKLMHALIRPKFLMPVHGEYRHLKQHIFVAGIGEVLEITNKDAKMNGTVPSGQLLVDGLGIGDVGNIVLRDRKHLSEDGLIIASAGITMNDGYCQVTSGPDIISRGFVFVRESDDLMNGARATVADTLYELEQENTNDRQYIRTRVKEDLKEYIWQTTKRNPMIFPILVEA